MKLDDHQGYNNRGWEIIEAERPDQGLSQYSRVPVSLGVQVRRSEEPQRSLITDKAHTQEVVQPLEMVPCCWLHFG